MINSTPKYDYIDALRGLAIIGIIVVHTCQSISPGNEFLITLFGNGDKGVQLFFLVSALTLCFSLDRKKNESKPTLYFFIRRFFRIAPMFYLAIVFFLMYPCMQEHYNPPDGIKWWHVLLTATFMHGWHPETFSSVVPGGWSIAVEFNFYLLLPFLFKLINTKERALIFFIFTSLINLFISRWMFDFWSAQYPGHLSLPWGLSYFGFFNQLPVFAIGIMLFHIFKEDHFRRKNFTSIILILFSAFIVLAFMNYNVDPAYLSRITFYTLAFAILTWALANKKNIILVNRVTILTGKVSYSMYFIHFVVISNLLKSSFFDKLVNDRITGSLFAILLVYLVTLAGAIVTYNLIEKNGIKLGSYIIKKIDNKVLRNSMLLKLKLGLALKERQE
jgi:peptidoglycan/LPS O-acetylase OafA/YrhL